MKEFFQPLRKMIRSPKARVVLFLLPWLAGPAACVLSDRTAIPDQPSQALTERPDAPDSLRAYGQDYDLKSLENPLKAKVRAQLKADPDQAYKLYAGAVQAGSDVYYANCVHCHGDLLDGEGMIAKGQDPAPTDFIHDQGFAEVSDSYLFWRIVSGGPGLPRKFAPWQSTMPAGERNLNQQQVWNVITFLGDHTGKLPKAWNQQVADMVSLARVRAAESDAETSAKKLYLSRCAVCHGETGEGDGQGAKFLYPSPRNFTLGLFKYKNSPVKDLRPRDQNLFQTIKNGLPRTAMPAWGSELSDDQIRGLIEVIKSFDWIGTWAPEDAPDEDFDEDGLFTGETISIAGEISVENRILPSPESLALGKEGFLKNCTPCHGDEGRGSPSAEKKLRDEWGDRIWPRDLTKPWTWRVTNVGGDPDQTMRNIFTRLSLGIPGTPMPEHTSGVSAETRWHIANYVYTLRDTTPSLSYSRFIQTSKIEGALPTSVDDGTWAGVQPTTLVMIPNVFGGERLFKPLNDSISVRVLRNSDEIAFLLEFDDRTNSRPGDPEAEKIRDPKLTLYPDAFAIQFPNQGAFTAGPVTDMPLFEHGDASHGTTIWYWRTESVEPSIAPATMVFDASGIGAELKPRLDGHTVAAGGEWVNGRWRVMFKRRLGAVDSRDVSFTDGAAIPISFAHWDGSNGESGSKHMLSSWYSLTLSPP